MLLSDSTTELMEAGASLSGINLWRHVHGCAASSVHGVETPVCLQALAKSVRKARYAAQGELPSPMPLTMPAAAAATPTQGTPDIAIELSPATSMEVSPAACRICSQSDLPHAPEIRQNRT